MGILITLSPELGIALHIQGAVNSGKAVMYCYAGLAFGDLTSGLLSQRLRSRKKVLYIFWALSAFSTALYFTLQGIEVQAFYYLCAFVGFTVGSWVVFMTAAAEQFGTNLRATAAVTIPNMVRGALPLILLLFKGMRTLTGSYVTGAWITGVLLMSVAVIAAIGLRESYGSDLDFIEE